MQSLRDKIENVAGGDRVDAITAIINNHMEWTDPDDCPFKHIYSGAYEVTNGFTLYHHHEDLGEYDSYEGAMAAAQDHKWGGL